MLSNAGRRQAGPKAAGTGGQDGNPGGSLLPKAAGPECSR